MYDQTDTDAEARCERNLETIEQGARAARIAAWSLSAVGAAALVAWAWSVLRVQADVLNQYGSLTIGRGDISSPSPSVGERIDLLADSFDTLVLAVLALCVGLFLRLATDYLVSRSGGDLPRVGPKGID